MTYYKKNYIETKKSSKHPTLSLNKLNSNLLTNIFISNIVYEKLWLRCEVSLKVSQIYTKINPHQN
jgi:hypothetical protein